MYNTSELAYINQDLNLLKKIYGNVNLWRYVEKCQF